MGRVLLPGAAGFLGADMLRTILDHTEHTVVAPVTFRHKGRQARLDWAAAGREDRVETLFCDLAATTLAASYPQIFGDVDFILNFASDTHPPRSVTEPVQFVRNNVDSTLHLLEYARQLPGLQAFIQISTDAVYGPAAAGQTHQDWNPIIPANPYAASKAAQEALVMSYWRSFKVPATIVTTMNPIGCMQDPEKFVPMTVVKILHGEPVHVHTDADGVPGARTYIDVWDVADGVLNILDTLPPTMTGPRLNRWSVVGTREISNLEVPTLIGEALNMTPDIRMVTVDRPEHGHRYAMSGQKLANAGWTPDRYARSTIDFIAAWTAEHREWLS